MGAATPLDFQAIVKTGERRAGGAAIRDQWNATLLKTSTRKAFLVSGADLGQSGFALPAIAARGCAGIAAGAAIVSIGEEVGFTTVAGILMTVRITRETLRGALTLTADWRCVGNRRTDSAACAAIIRISVEIQACILTERE